jgi:hypothetical protein
MADEVKDDDGTLRVYGCSKDLLARVKAKAALKRKDQSDWVRQVLERETAQLKPIQEEYQREKDD